MSLCHHNKMLKEVISTYIMTPSEGWTSLFGWGGGGGGGKNKIPSVPCHVQLHLWLIVVCMNYFSLLLL